MHSLSVHKRALSYFVSFFRAAKPNQQPDDKIYDTKLPVSSKPSTSRGKVRPNNPKQTLSHTMSATKSYLELDFTQQGTISKILLLKI